MNQISSFVVGLLLGLGIIAWFWPDKPKPPPTPIFPLPPISKPNSEDYWNDRVDGPPFRVGDEPVFLKSQRLGFSWTVEKVEGSKVTVVRELKGKEWSKVERETYPEDILIRIVQWKKNEPEPPKRTK